MGATNTKQIQYEISVIMVASSNKKLEIHQKKDEKGVQIKGVKYDIQKFKDKFKSFNPKFIETNKDEGQLLSKKFIMDWLSQQFSAPVDDIHLFYTGSGHKNGDWQIQTLEKPLGDKISLKQVLQLWNSCKASKKSSRLFLYLDSCYSGSWCNRLAKTQEEYVTIIASCQSDKKANASATHGGLLFNCLLCTDSEFEENYKILMQNQKPIRILLGKKLAPLSKEELKTLQKNIKNIGQILQSTQQKKQIINFPKNDKFGRLHYEGQVKNGKMEGKGVLFIKNIGKYDGEFKEEKYSGKGTFYYKEGDRYEGEFKNSQLNGQGIMYWSRGDRYQGNWKDGWRQGQGIYYWRNGDRYQGEWKKGKKEGRGIRYYKFGARYQGEWKDNQKIGKGIYYSQNGDKYEQQYKDGKITGKDIKYYSNGRYEGEFKDSKKEGYGIFYFDNGDRYQGQFKDDVIEGKGTKYWSDGNIYQGDFKNNNREGKGIMYWYEGNNRYEGQYKNDKGEGKGIFYWANGDRVVGEWTNDLISGKATYYSHDGIVKQREYWNGMQTR